MCCCKGSTSRFGSSACCVGRLSESALWSGRCTPPWNLQSSLEPPFFAPDINRSAVCQAVGYNIGTVARKKDKSNAIRIMAAGASEIVKELYRSSHVDGIISLGGAQGTYIAAQAMRELPFGVPKILVSTIVAGDVKDYVGCKDITLMHSITDILGLNSFNKRLFTQAASAICGMIQPKIHQEKERSDDL